MIWVILFIYLLGILGITIRHRGFLWALDWVWVILWPIAVIASVIEAFIE